MKKDVTQHRALENRVIRENNKNYVEGLVRTKGL